MGWLRAGDKVNINDMAVCAGGGKRGERDVRYLGVSGRPWIYKVINDAVPPVCCATVLENSPLIYVLVCSTNGILFLSLL